MIYGGWETGSVGTKESENVAGNFIGLCVIEGVLIRIGGSQACRKSAFTGIVLRLCWVALPVFQAGKASGDSRVGRTSSTTEEKAA